MYSDYSKNVNELGIKGKKKSLTFYLIYQFLALQIQQQIKIWCQKYGQMGIQLQCNSYSYNGDIALKTLWEKEKLFVMSNFSFSHKVF